MRLQASKAHIWAKEDGCTGYTRLYHTARPESERDMSAADEGREAHRIAEEVLLVPTREGEGEMWDYARIYMDHVYEHLEDSSELIIEKKLTTSFGKLTPIVDAATWNPDTRVLRVYEYKYGTGPVEVERNPQLMLGVDALISSRDWDPEEIHLYVYQPRAFHRDGDFRMWTCTNEEFDEFIGVALTRYSEHENGNGMCRTGKHCLRCPVMLKCEAHTNSTMSCLEFSEMPEEWERDSEAIGREYELTKRILKQLEKRVEALKVEVECLTSEGANTGFYLGERALPLAWNRPVDEMIAMSKVLGVDISKAPTILTPTQVLDRKIMDEQTLLNFAGRPSPAKVLKKLDGDVLKEKLK